MSIVSKLKAATPAIVATTEVVGGLFAFGWAQNKYREKASFMGVPADLLAGGILTAASVALSMTSKGKKYASHARNLGLAGLGAYAHTRGASLGAQQSGVVRVLVDKNDLKKVQAAIPGRATVLGAIPQAPVGDRLSTAQLMEMAS